MRYPKKSDIVRIVSGLIVVCVYIIFGGVVKKEASSAINTTLEPSLVFRRRSFLDRLWKCIVTF